MRRPINEAIVSDTPATVVARTKNSDGIWRVVAIILILSGLAFLINYGAGALAAITADSAVKGKEYQALFLTNGQVYFGKLSHTDSSYVKLTNIYYLQVQQSVQPSSSASSSAANQQVSLAKLGGELHGPEDAMYVSRAQVLFWENLKTDGKVTQAINNYQSSNK
ncbi:hypothetical protein HJC99_04035 [Candidatus Saccharibacteria bacterium]|nr:hypothetical protein [Candidatus Saccharibacteria bacterium]